VRGSVDAGQPDTADTRVSIRNLIAAQEKPNARTGYQLDFGKVNSTQVNALEKTEHRRSQKRPNINVTTNPLDISLIGATQPCNTQGCNIQSSGSTKSRGRSAGKFSLDNSLLLSTKDKERQFLGSNLAAFAAYNGWIVRWRITFATQSSMIKRKKKQGSENSRPCHSPYSRILNVALPSFEMRVFLSLSPSLIPQTHYPIHISIGNLLEHGSF